MKKLAFCFLIYDDINHEELWHMFFKNVDPNKYSIYIHYKIDKELKFFNKYKLTNCIETKYAHISLVKAQNILLQEALTDNSNTNFIFVSGSCIPLTSFNHVYDFLNSEYSYFGMFPREQCFPRCNILYGFVKREYIQKASQWTILNRKHASLMIESTEYLAWYENIYAADEHCYIINIYINNLQNEIIHLETTFTNWAAKGCSPKNYETINKEDLHNLLKSKALFGRKFDKKCQDSLQTEQYINAITTP